jgi:phosphoribosyl 1,2-cyclic phosphodiesterase
VAAGFVTYTQRRWTGGIRFIDDVLQVHLDPGIGGVVRSVESGLSLEKIRLLLVSHNHPDHCGDAPIFIEGMTKGTTRHRGTLIASRSVLQGNDVTGPSIDRYHQSLVRDVIEAHPGDNHNIQGMNVQVSKARHTDPDGVGYVLEFPEVGKIGYTSDTSYFNEIANPYHNVRILILCTTRPRGAPLKGHLATDDAVKIVSLAKPELAILTHFGMKMLNEHPNDQAKYVQESTGIRTLASFDGMVVSLQKEIKIQRMENIRRRVQSSGRIGEQSKLETTISGSRQRL